MTGNIGAVLFLLIAAVQRTEAACTFPSALTGQWHSSRWGTITFSSGNTVSVTNLESMGNLDFECEVNSGSIYVIKSTTSVTVLANPVDVVACLDLVQVSSIKYYYYHATSEVTLPSGGTEPVKLVSTSASVTVSSACDISSPYDVGTNHMLIASGSETAAATQCPDPFLATFNNYTVDKGSGSQCGGVGYIHVCDDLKSIAVDYSVCSETIFYSSGGSLECVYYSSEGSTYFINVYNFDSSVDDSTTFRFACIAVAYGSSGTVEATQYPMACDTNQTATYVPSSPYTGGTFVLAANLPTASDDSSSPIVIIIIVILIILLLIVAAALAYRYRRKLPCAKKESTQVTPAVTVTRVQSPKAQEPRDTPAANGHKTLKERPSSGIPPASSATPATDNEHLRTHLQSSQSTRSVATPSNLQPAIADTDTAATTTAETTTIATATETTTTSTATDTAVHDATTIDITNPFNYRLPPLETQADPATLPHEVVP